VGEGSQRLVADSVTVRTERLIGIHVGHTFLPVKLHTAFNILHLVKNALLA
jgi:hypothetical protein